MSRNGYLLAGTLVLCVAAAGSALAIQALDKGGALRPDRLLSGYFALLASPLAGVAAAAVWWRRHRWPC